MAVHLRYRLTPGSINRHPKQLMEEWGITYQHSTPQTMGDQWWFWNCENVPDNLPNNLELLNEDPMKNIGWGLTEEQAKEIRDYKKSESASFAIYRSGNGHVYIYKNGKLIERKYEGSKTIVFSLANNKGMPEPLDKKVYLCENHPCSYPKCKCKTRQSNRQN